ncbi:MAG: AAA family ATPase [Firmicutes bacterium]|nr:AAA family ATPase [Bacillota bacterium]MBQ5415133.1 AAA family ATPase [Bacillota bacterium]
MAKVIALAGKGGTGKTTTGGMIIRYLAEKGKGPILAVDADANSNLNEVLGMKVESTLGDIREDIAHAELAEKSPIPPGMTKPEYMEMMLQDALAEGDEYDLLVMGRTQGKGCYCYVNGILQSQLTKYINNYNYLVVDNEAGMEHIARGILPRIDVLLLISDCSRRGIEAVSRIAEMVKDLGLDPPVVKLIVNRAPGGKLNEGTSAAIKEHGLDLLAVLPHEDLIYQMDSDGEPTAFIPADSPIKQALYPALDTLGL